MRSLLTLAFATCLLPTAYGQLGAEPSKEMKALDGLLGEWTGLFKLTPPGATEPMEMPSTVNVKTYGVYQETVYTMEMAGFGTFIGHSFTSYDSASKAYKSWTFDNNAGAPRTESGSFDGKKLSMVSDPHGGMVTRATYEIKAKDEILLVIEMKDGEKYTKLGECLYKRKS